MLKKYLPVLFFIPLGYYLSIAIFTYARLGLYNRYLADDYCVAYVARDSSLIQSLYFWYNNWHGAYSVVVIDEVLEYVDPLRLPLVVLIVLISWLVLSISSLYNLLPVTEKPAERWLKAIPLGLVFVFTLLVINPDVPQSLFWWSGVRAYNFPVLLATLYLGVYAWLRRRDLNRWLAVFLGFTIVFFAGGFSEIFTAIQVVLILGLAGLEILVFKTAFLKKTSFPFWVGSLLGAILALLVMVLAPGNSVRQSEFDPPGNLFFVLDYSWHEFTRFLQEIASQKITVISLLGTLLVFIWAGANTKNMSRSPWLGLLFLLGGFSVMYACFVPPVYAMSSSPPYRSLSIATYFLTVFLLISAFLFGQSFAHWARRIYFPISMVLLITGVVLLSFSSIETHQAWRAKEKVYVEFAEKFDRVHRMILRKKGKGEKSVIIPPMKNWALLGDPGQDPSYWINKCYSDYYGVEIRQE